MAYQSSRNLSCGHAQHKIPAGDSPYVKAKHVQLVEKDPNRAIALFWSAINAGDRVDSALKDMAVVMKQVNRAEEAIEAIKSFRRLCSFKAQEPLDNVLLDLYKKCGMITEQIDLLNYKLRMIDEGIVFSGRITKTAKSQGKKFHVTVEQQKSRLLGNLAWAYMQCENYNDAESLYRKALEIENDYNKVCNLAICLMQTGRIAEAKTFLKDVKKPTNDSIGEAYQKSFERAWEIMNELELKSDQKAGKCKEKAQNPALARNDRSNTVPSYSEVAVASPSEFATPLLDFKNDRWDESYDNGKFQVSSDDLTQSNGGNSSSQEISKVTLSGYSLQRTKADRDTENLVISVEIKMHRSKTKPSVTRSKKRVPLASNDQCTDSLKASADVKCTNGIQKAADAEGTVISFGSLDLSSPIQNALGPEAEPLSTSVAKKLWADMVEEDEQQLACDNSASSLSKELSKAPFLKNKGRSWADMAEEEESLGGDQDFKFGSIGGNQQPVLYWKNCTHDTWSSGNLKPGYDPNRRYGVRKEPKGKSKGALKNNEEAQLSSVLDLYPRCDLGSRKLEPVLLGSDYMSRMGGKYSCEKQRNRLQVFTEITPGDAKA